MGVDLQWQVAIADKVTAPAKAVEKSLGGVEKSLKDVDKTMSMSGKASKAFGEVVTGALRGLGDRFVGFAVSAVGSLADAGLAFAKLALSAHGAKEDNKLALTTILGDAQKADAALAQINGLSNFLGQDPKPLTDALIDLTSKGHSTADAMAILQGSLDLKAMNGGKKSLDQILETFTELDAKGKAGEDTVEKFAKLGIKRESFLAELAKQLKTDAKGAAQVMKDGTLNVGAAQNIALKALTNQTGGELGTFSKMHAESWNGLVGNLSSVGDRFATALDTDTALAPVKELMKKLTDALNPESATGKKLLGVLSNVAKEIGGAIGKIDFDKLADAVSRAATALSNGYDNAKLFLGELIAKSKMAYESMSKVSAVVDTLTGKTKSSSTGITDAAVAWDKIGKVLGIVGGAIAFIGSRLMGSFTTGFLVAVDVVNGAVDRIKGAFGAVSSLVSSAFDGGFFDTLKGIGTSIVDGVWNGIKNAWSAFIGKFKALVDLLPDAAKKALGIASPSKEFRWIGQMTTLGMVEGVNDNADDVKSSLVGLATPPAPVAGSSTTNNSSRTISPSVSVVINFDGGAGGAKPEDIESAVRRGVERAFGNLALESGAL